MGHSVAGLVLICDVAKVVEEEGRSVPGIYLAPRRMARGGPVGMDAGAGEDAGEGSGVGGKGRGRGRNGRARRQEVRMLPA